MKNKFDTVYILSKYLPLVKTEAYGFQHPKVNHHDLSKIIQGASTFHHKQFI